MPVPTLVTDLSTTAASNSPSGSDNVFPDLDNYLRAMSGFIASIRDNSGNGWVSPYLPLTYSAGTANGVMYLNGSNVVTTGSGLVFDGTNLGIGTASPQRSLHVNGSTGAMRLQGTSFGGYIEIVGPTTTNFIGTPAAISSGSTTDLAFYLDGSERARITSNGDWLVGKTSLTNPLTTDGAIWYKNNSGGGGTLYSTNGGTGTALALGTQGDALIASFYRSGTVVGSISVTTTATAYNTSSDYRLKDDPQPLTNSGAFIDSLKPKTWQWKANGSRGVGFLAHEAQEVSPSSVTGAKDAVDEDGNPVMQAMEYGSAEFIANIVAELQSLRARVAALEA